MHLIKFGGTYVNADCITRIDIGSEGAVVSIANGPALKLDKSEAATLRGMMEKKEVMVLRHFVSVTNLDGTIPGE